MRFLGEKDGKALFDVNTTEATFDFHKKPPHDVLGTRMASSLDIHLCVRV
jgi:hypothetical protein